MVQCHPSVIHTALALKSLWHLQVSRCRCTSSGPWMRRGRARSRAPDRSLLASRGLPIIDPPLASCALRCGTPSRDVHVDRLHVSGLAPQAADTYYRQCCGHWQWRAPAALSLASRTGCSSPSSPWCHMCAADQVARHKLACSEGRHRCNRMCMLPRIRSPSCHWGRPCPDGF